MFTNINCRYTITAAIYDNIFVRRWWHSHEQGCIYKELMRLQLPEFQEIYLTLFMSYGLNIISFKFQETVISIQYNIPSIVVDKINHFYTFLKAVEFYDNGLPRLKSKWH